MKYRISVEVDCDSDATAEALKGAIDEYLCDAPAWLELDYIAMATLEKIDAQSSQ